MAKFRVTYEIIQTIVSEVEAEDRWQAIDNIKVGDTISEEVVSEELSDEGFWEIEGSDEEISFEENY